MWGFIDGTALDSNYAFEGRGSGFCGTSGGPITGRWKVQASTKFYALGGQANTTGYLTRPMPEYAEPSKQLINYQQVYDNMMTARGNQPVSAAPITVSPPISPIQTGQPSNRLNPQATQATQESNRLLQETNISAAPQGNSLFAQYQEKNSATNPLSATEEANNKLLMWESTYAGQ